MKYTCLFPFLLTLTAMVSCKNEPLKKVGNAADTLPFFSTNNFFAGEIKQVCATPYYIYIKTVDPNGSKDSIKCTDTLFKQLAHQFLSCDINEKNVKKNYTESSFRDLSTKSVTLNYSTLNKKLPIQNIDVLLDEETSKVKWVFIKRIDDNKDSTTTTQYSWKAGKSFMINRSTTTKDGTVHTGQQWVSWNNND